MSAPASLTPVNFNNLLAISSTPQGAALLKITPESLRKGGFDSLSWINYLNNVVLPQCIVAKNTFIETIAEPNNARSEKANLQTAKVKHLEIVAILKEIKFTIKDWKKPMAFF